MSMTYILQMDGPEPLVKFGRSRNPKSRITSLKTGFPWPLRLVALIGADIEYELKQEFAADKVQGEWFRPTPALRARVLALSADGKMVKQVAVDQSYVNAVIKPRIREYLNGREPTNNAAGDLVRCIFADLLPSIAGRETELVKATKGHVTDALARGFGPTNETPHLVVADEAAADLNVLRTASLPAGSCSGAGA